MESPLQHGEAQRLSSKGQETKDLWSPFFSYGPRLIDCWRYYNNLFGYFSTYFLTRFGVFGSCMRRKYERDEKLTEDMQFLLLLLLLLFLRHTLMKMRWMGGRELMGRAFEISSLGPVSCLHLWHPRQSRGISHLSSRERKKWNFLLLILRHRKRQQLLFPRVYPDGSVKY